MSGSNAGLFQLLQIYEFLSKSQQLNLHKAEQRVVSATANI